LHGSGGPHHSHQQAGGIDQDVTLTTVDQFVLVEAPVAWHGRGFDTLTIQTAAGRVFVAAGPLPHLGPQRIVDAFPGATTFPSAKVAVYKTNKGREGCRPPGLLSSPEFEPSDYYCAGL
jgi:hypothetical protein